MECEECPMVARVEILEKAREDHETRIKLLEDFKKWAKPILEAISTMNNSMKWMIAIATFFAAICAFVYVFDIKPLQKQQYENQIEILKKINDVKIDIVKSSKANYRGTKKVIEKEISSLKDKK